jgi:hypothetical protein
MQSHFSHPAGSFILSGTASHSRRLLRARFALPFSALCNKGRGECRVPSAPAASCALWVVSMRTSIHSEFTGSARHSRTRWFTAYSGLSPVIGFLATVISGNDFPRT